MLQLCRRWMSTGSSITRQEYKVLGSEDIEYFQSILRPEGVVTDEEALATHNTDWLNKYHGKSRLLLKPKTTEEVSKILSYCNKTRLAVVPQGGNTGVVGGSVPVFDEIILSTASMNQIESFDTVSGILTSQAGCILENLDTHAAKQGYMMPLDLGAKGTCQIGGNVSTNAGGLRLLRYGSLHGSVIGLEAVLADGTVLDCLSTMRKDNTGYDLKQLFIGSEGTLGVVTKVAIQTPPRPESVNVALIGCTDYDSVRKAFVTAKQNLGEILSAVEFMDRQSLDMVFSQQDWSKDPLDNEYPYYVLIETSGSREDHDMEKLEGYLEKVMEDGTVVDGTVAQDRAQARKLFLLREDITTALTSRGYVYKYDVSVPFDRYYELVQVMRERLTDHDAVVVGFGHLGDSNLHLNVSTKENNPQVFELIEPFIFQWTAQHGGSISAEHGIGLHKPEYLHLSKSPAAIEKMKQIKSLFDPNGILNPYKLFLQR